MLNFFKMSKNYIIVLHSKNEQWQRQYNSPTDKFITVPLFTVINVSFRLSEVEEKEKILQSLSLYNRSEIRCTWIQNNGIIKYHHLFGCSSIVTEQMQLNYYLTVAPLFMTSISSIFFLQAVAYWHCVTTPQLYSGLGMGTGF